MTIVALPQSHDCDCGQLQYTLYGASLEEHLEPAAGSKCRGLGRPLIRAYYIFGLLAALVANVLPDSVQGAIKPFMPKTAFL